MRKILAVVLALAGAAVTSVAPGAAANERAGLINFLLKEASPEVVRASRNLCASGAAQKKIDRSRSLGNDGLLDAVDECPVILLRQAREGALLAFYSALLTQLVGKSDGHEHLPMAIATTVMRGENQVPVGSQRAAVVSAALAFDAGFTVAFQGKTALSPAMPELAALRLIANRCLQQQEPNLGLCYATGFTLGARAVSGQPVT